MILAIGLFWIAVNGDTWAQTQQPAPTPVPPAPAGQPANPSPVVVGIVDVPFLLSQSKGGKSLNSQSEARRKALQAELLKQEENFRTQQQQLLAQRASLQPADYQKKEQDLAASYQKFREGVGAKKKSYETAHEKAYQQLSDALSKVLTEFASQRGINLILSRQNVVVSDEKWDITAEVLKRLDAAIVSVKF